MKYFFLTLFLFTGIATSAQDSLTLNDIAAAERLMGLKFKPAERDSLFDDVKVNRKEYQKMRKYQLDNSIPLSTWQSPMLPGMKFNMKQAPVSWIIPANISIPANKNELAFYSILQLASLIKNKKISSVELTKFFIGRLKKFSDTLQCVITITENIALQEAMEADIEIAAGKYRGPLHGIPYGLKDLFAVKGTRTTWALHLTKNR